MVPGQEFPFTSQEPLPFPPRKIPVPELKPFRTCQPRASPGRPRGCSQECGAEHKGATRSDPTEEPCRLPWFNPAKAALGGWFPSPQAWRQATPSSRAAF